MRIRITNKVKENIKLKNFDYEQANNSSSFLNEWYINLLLVEKKKYYIFTESVTLYSKIIPAKGITTREKIHEVMIDVVMKILIRNTLSDEIVDLKNIEICKTNNRSIVGSQNDLIYMAQSEFYYHGFDGLESINETPLSYINSSPYREYEKEIRKVNGNNEVFV